MYASERDSKGDYHLFHEAERSGFPSDADIAERGFGYGHVLLLLCSADDPEPFFRLQEWASEESLRK